MQNLYSHKHLYTNVHRSFIHKSPKLEPFQIFFNGWMDRYIVYIPLVCHGMLVSNKKELTINTGNNLDGSQGIYTEWIKPIPKAYRLYDFVYIKSHPLLGNNTEKYSSKCAKDPVQLFIWTTVLKQMASTVPACGFLAHPSATFYCYLGDIFP